VAFRELLGRAGIDCSAEIVDDMRVKLGTATCGGSGASDGTGDDGDGVGAAAGNAAESIPSTGAIATQRYSGYGHELRIPESVLCHAYDGMLTSDCTDPPALPWLVRHITLQGTWHD
jgi:hypothetical protein